MKKPTQTQKRSVEQSYTSVVLGNKNAAIKAAEIASKMTTVPTSFSILTLLGPYYYEISFYTAFYWRSRIYLRDIELCRFIGP